jgi:Permease family
VQISIKALNNTSFRHPSSYVEFSPQFKLLDSTYTKRHTISEQDLLGYDYQNSFLIGSVVGTSFATIPVATGAFAQWYANGTCPSDSTGAHLPCPEGYGAVLGTACVCALLEIGLSFMPPKALKKAFPPLVTGPVVLLIGVNLVGTGY